MIAPILAATEGNVWETASFQAAVFLAIFTMFAGLCTGAWAVWQRRKDLRWKQAELARTLLDEIFDFQPSDNAWKMVDGQTSFRDGDGLPINITMEDVRQALQVPLRQSPEAWASRADRFIRECFDALFYFLERLEHSVEIKVARFEDLIAPTSYYIELMAQDKELFQKYAEFVRFRKAVAFMNRFREWRTR